MGENEAAISAAVRNHTSWMTAQAESVGGGRRAHGALGWIVSARGGGASLPFPDAVAPADADAMLADCRASDQRGIGCWTSGLEPIGEIAAVLVARGFEWGWSAHWMSFDLDALPRIDDDRVRVEPGPVRDSWRAMATGGQAVVHLADGEAGLYDVGVDPGMQRTGLGRALTVAALRAARRQGATLATVNATEDGERLYRSVGARSHGHGQTFWIHRDGLGASPPASLVAAAEAAGRGDVPAGLAPEVLAARLPGNGMGLAHVAQQAGHPDAARALAARGAPLDAMLAYELDGADGLRGVALDEPIGRLGGTVLHEAVRIRDTALLRAALALGADTAVRDRTYDATPLDWARHLHNPEAEELLTSGP
jgi:ribosomal protein S18 acetylase RimI-like enzyme